MRQDAVLQAKVDERLQEQAELAKTGTISKVKSQRGGKVEVIIKTMWNGHMNSYFLELTKKGSHTTS